mgnify:CR=1 FL=1
MTNQESPAGWYSDPTGQGDARYWNGAAWTQSVNRGGVTADVAIDPSQAQIPPAPGTQVAPPPTPAAATPQTVNVPSSKSSPLGIIVGVAAVLLVIVLIVALVSGNDSSDDTPTPGTDAPAEQPAEEPADEPAPAEGS